MTDPVLQELWEIKEGLAKECGHDLRRLFDRLKTAQESPRGKLVNRTSVRTSPTGRNRDRTASE
jgi:hypothetical protein